MKLIHMCYSKGEDGQKVKVSNCNGLDIIRFKQYIHHT